MLSDEAYTFRRKALLATALSWVGGFTNVIALLTCGQTVSHQTGNSTHLGRGLGELISGFHRTAESAGSEAALAGFMVVLFFTGAACSGLLTEWAKRNGRASRYIVPITIEAILLSIVELALLIWPDPLTARPIAIFVVVGMLCVAMGLQNATITRISGSVVRTTHLTGVITDMGLDSAQLFSWILAHQRSGRSMRLADIIPTLRREPSAQRLALLASIFSSFLLGVTLGTILHLHVGAAALLLPIGFLSLLVIQQCLMQVRRPSQQAS